MITGRIEKELSEASSQRRTIGGSEAEQHYIYRVVKAALDLPDDKWSELSPDAQNFCKLVAEAHNARPQQRYPDWPPDAPALATDRLQNLAGGEGAAGPKAVRGRRPGGVGSVVAATRLIMVENPSISMEALMAKLRVTFPEPNLNTVLTVRSDTLNVLRLIPGFKERINP